MSYSNGPKIVTDGLVLCLDGNQKSYPNTGVLWYDMSPSKKNGTLTNGPVFNSSNGGNFLFNGANSYVNFPTAVDIKTILFFVNPTATTGDYVIHGPLANGADNWLGINVNRAYLFITESSDVNNFTFAGGTISPNNWYQIGATIGDNTAKIYLDGKNVNSATVAWTIGTWNSAFNIGKRGGLAQRYFDGKIGNVQGYNRVLSDDEILQNFNAMRGRFNS